MSSRSTDGIVAKIFPSSAQGCRPQILWAPIWPAMKSSSELIRHGVLLGDDLVNRSQCWGAHRHVFTKDWLPNPYAGASSTITSKILGLVFIGSSLLECRRAIPIANHTDRGMARS